MLRKAPKLIAPTGDLAKALRLELGFNQSLFWGRIAVTQPAGSRYESGRDIPRPVALLLELAYGPEKRAADMLKTLRGEPPQD